jgi:mRNA interferase RelE/StbE
LVYKVLYKASVEKDLKKLDKSVAKNIIHQIENKLTKDPKYLGKQLSGLFKGLRSFRIGEYRVIFRMSEDEILILVLRISHRKDVYK